MVFPAIIRKRACEGRNAGDCEAESAGRPIGTADIVTILQFISRLAELLAVDVAGMRVKV